MTGGDWQFPFPVPIFQNFSEEASLKFQEPFFSQADFIRERIPRSAKQKRLFFPGEEFSQNGAFPASFGENPSP
jgi:hypothetical protein